MQLRARLAAAGLSGQGRRPAPPPAAVPPGFQAGANRLGTVAYRDQHWPLDHKHGEVRLEGALALDQVLLQRLAPDLDNSDMARAAYLDIETTGLSGGTGTYAFLVGVGTFESFTFRVRQFFLADPSGEGAMLAAISETVDRCRALVTFNGKSFDLPQLSTRYALNRLAPPGHDLPHIDLLHPSRRLFGRKLESCRLAEIEREFLGLRRFGDVPSWMIPGLYFAFIRRRDSSGLPPVFEHNTQDVLSLAALLAVLNGIAGDTVDGDPDHLLVLARWDESRGRVAEAEALYERIWTEHRAHEASAEAAWRLARTARKRGDWKRTQSIWDLECHSSSLRRRIRALVELAKIAEHRLHDSPRALVLARAAAGLLDRDVALAGMLPRTSAALVHRLARLERRVGNAGSAAPAR